MNNIFTALACQLGIFMFVIPLINRARYVGKQWSNFFFLVRPKKKCMFQVTYIIFPDFNKKHNRYIVCQKYIMKRIMFGPK